MEDSSCKTPRWRQLKSLLNNLGPKQFVEAVNTVKNPVIIDVSRDIAGLETIKAWAEREVFGGVYTLHEVYLEEDSTRILLSFAPTGVGGFRAWYTITQQGDGLIQVMDLQYAR